ncbi:MAG: NosD domain-containing protein [Candidatus Hermodarchaeota archaeon]
MLRGKKGFLLVVTCVLVVAPILITFGTSFYITESKDSSYTIHEPIKISSDTALAANAVKGSGNETDPFILEGWKINAKDHNYGIYIHKTSKYVIIRNCWIEASSSHEDSGIFIEDVTPGTVTVVNNTVERCWKGIVVQGVNSTKIINNTIRFNGAYGIAYYGYYDEHYVKKNANYVTIENNTCTQNFNIGIYLSGVENSSISGNLIADNKKWGLYYALGSFNRISSNSFIQNKKNAGLDYYFVFEFAYFINRDDRKLLTETFGGNYWSDYKGTGNYTVWEWLSQGEYPLRVFDINPLLESPHNYIPKKVYIIELSLLMTVIFVFGVVGGIVTAKALPQVITNDSTLTQIYIMIIKSGLGILLIQNALILVFVLNFRGMETFDEMGLISVSIFHLDLFGFTFLGIGYLFYSSLQNDTKAQYIQVGAFLLGWVVCRIIIQYIIPFGIVLHEYDEPLNYQTFAFYLVYRGFYENYYDLSFPLEDYYGFDSPPLIIILTFVVGGLLLYLASRSLPQEFNERGVTLFKIYGIVNVILIFILPLIYYQERNIIGIFTYNQLTAEIPLLIKVTVVPILGLCAFGYMFHEIRLLKGRAISNFDENDNK